ncbi:uncharacterized protein LOC128997459 [Macrosteles quadrilineatus]|uniref:uncharacterized protein LOC128997459 n=1 Tax=Macrosteles quadrilineatus TaxID=74068 RepID=UPI0023E0B5FC|nr:uncharacterized protein LOC128997459 [Macrosteles quadrilineatus]
MVTVDVHDGPIDLVLNFVRDNNDKCTVLNELDDTLLAKYRVENFKGGNNKGQYQSRVKTLMEDLVQKGWPYYSYKEEVKRFLIEIFIEFYNRKHNLFDLDGQQLRLKQYCKSLTIQPSIPTEKPTMEPPIPTPSIDPVSLPPTCRDEYLYNRTQEFNIIDPTLVLKYIDMPNECVNPSWKRVLIKDRQLSPYPLHHSQYKNNGDRV